MRTRTSRRARVALAALVVPTLALLPAAPVAADPGTLKLTVAGDGADGVTVQAVHADGRRPDLPIRLVLTATGPDGRKLGPRPLEPAGEGRGFYATGPLLTPGRWKVTVAAPNPPGGTATATVEATAAEPVPPPPTARALAGAPDVTRIRADGRADERAWWFPVGIGAVALLVVAGAVTVLTGRRRRS
ncbi:hypothetical protein O7606_23865 [Micromonospora sp. WMMD882]|uniref:hypothetical protein n=1 Tax=Micromonospora sp. WMMD882 TaxID=3015151 RepID=UPI00248BB60B|nr:hypothetical protein [Micromonospora sp. WMMD882]WBB79181.1 hypothetical protein O7606_23865 [Micromonospora sp. WMMD882]